MPRLVPFMCICLLCGIILRTDGHAPCSVQKYQDGVHVDCCCRQLVTVPVAWPDDVVWLDLSHNQMMELPDLAHPSLSRLHHLNLSNNVLKELDQHALRGLSDLQFWDVSHNLLHVVGNLSFIGLYSVETLNLGHNRLKWILPNAFEDQHNLKTLLLDNNELNDVSSVSFSGLFTIEHLDLSFNNLTVIVNNAFSQLSGLRLLILSDSHIHSLEVNAMVGLSNLISLDLARNRLQYQDPYVSSLPAGVFASLASLQELYLNDNILTYQGDYPQNVFNDLVSLRHLSIDSFSDLYFGADFVHLRSIQTLNFSGSSCQIVTLRNDSFEGFKNSSLRTIAILSCQDLLKIEACTFCNFPHLKNLYVTHSHFLRPVVAFKSLYGLRGQNMEEISFLGAGNYMAEGVTIDRSTALYLRTICVKKLSIADSRIMRLTGDALYRPEEEGVNLARCLEHFDISRNIILGDFVALFNILTYFQRLISFSIQEQFVYSLDESACMVSKSLDCENRRSDLGPAEMQLSVPIPVNLSYFNISSALTSINSPSTYMNFKSADKLKILDLSYGTLANCLTTFVGLETLEIFNIGGNFCYNISDTIFDHLDSLRQLSLYSCRLNPDDIRTRAHRLFQNLDRLETLDLSRNRLIAVEGNSLPAQVNLRELILSDNSFQSVPVDVNLHPNLTVLDLSFNSITTLTSAEQIALDVLSARQAFRLQLRGNPLLCACSNLNFLRWVWDTSVIFDGEGSNNRRYTCTSETGEITNTEQVMADWEIHWRRCIGQRAFGLAVSAFFLQLLSLVIVYLIARSWTHLRYTWKVMRNLRLPKRQDFRKDAYVVYADQDCEYACLQLLSCLQPLGVRLLLRDQEDLPGSIKAENIVKHIVDSWKVILLVTPAFAQDDWSCGFTVQQAQRSITDTLPDRILVVFLEDPHHLPPMASLELLMRNYPERNVFHVHKDTPVGDPAWKRLAEAIIGQDHYQ